MSAPRRLILASASPRRRELLAELGLPFEVRATEVDESPLAGEEPAALVARLALAKARAAAEPGAIVLGADTVVVAGEVVFGKPRDATAARGMLAELSGRTHSVWTGVALVRGDASDPSEARVRSCRTGVRFRVLSSAEIDAYVASGEPLDKAGAYAIQGGAQSFVEELDGDYTNVVGLPLPLVREILAEAGFAPLADRLSRRT